MTTIAHMALPAAIACGFLRQSRLNCRIWAAGLFGFAGALPDVLTFGAYVFGADRWEYYTLFHTASWWWFLPPAKLHVWMDSFLHAPMGGIVEPWYYVAEAVVDILSAALLWWCMTYEAK